MKIQLMKPRAALAAALLLPIVILGVVWGTTYRTAQQGQEWLIPIQGYDPRDLLRGHYVQYRYDWPRDLPPDGRPVNDLPFADQLCIEGVAPHIKRVRPVTAVVGVFDQNEIRGCAIIARATLGARREVQGLNSGIFCLAGGRTVPVASISRSQDAGFRPSADQARRRHPTGRAGVRPSQQMMIRCEASGTACGMERSGR